MSDKPDKATAAQQVELAVRKIDSLPILPCVAAQFLPKLLDPHFRPAALADIIESDPALAAATLSLMHRQGIILADDKLSLRRALDKLPAELVRDALLSLKVCSVFDSDKSVPEKQLLQHSLAVACCAKDIAEIPGSETDSELSYLAGLLHDIGKLALAQAIPKSFDRIVEETKQQKTSTYVIEEKYLGTDHTILGKRLAQRWHFPEAITLALWLHRSDTETISETMPEAKIAQIVQLADCIAHQCNIGQSGSYDSPDSADKMAEALEVTPEQLEQIRRNLGEQVERKAKVLGLDLPRPAAAYCDTAGAAVAQLAKDNANLSKERRQLQISLHHFDFITDFLSSINSSTSSIDIAEDFAAGWQKFYQTGMVCLYLAPTGHSQSVQAVVVENLSQSKVLCLSAAAGRELIPKPIAREFAILNAYDYLDWLFEQLDVEFDFRQTKLMPLLADGRAVGAIAFELRYPGDVELFEENFKLTTSVAGAVLDMALAQQGQQRFAERFAGLVGKSKAAERKEIPQQEAPTAVEAKEPESSNEKSDPANSTDALAEMAAGAAHELNNPLSVISGRAQMLAGSESDPERKQALELIEENAGELSAIIDNLMGFAKPPRPQPTHTNIQQMLEEAILLAGRKANREQLDVQIEISEGGKDVFVDSAQIASAIANIFCNSLQSYDSGAGPIKVTAGLDDSDDFVTVQISDEGCGMDEQTLQKATWPFFSARPAGRGKGMGLAHAVRLIELNAGSLQITSEPGVGTTVIITLPCKEISA